MQNARGRILYDFSGSACEGYTLEFRQVAELDNGEGKISLSDLRSNTWEDGAAKSYRFTRRTISIRSCSTRSTARRSAAPAVSR